MAESSSSVSYFETPTRRLAYRYIPPRSVNHTVVFLSGFRSDMTGEKGQFLQSVCQGEGRGFLAFDYSGHGLSSGRFEEGTISQWLADSLDLMDNLTQGPLIVVGSSMGGWLAHLVALARPYRVKGLLGIAAAPDFTQELMWEKFTFAQQAEIMNQGWTVIPTEYNSQGWTITRGLIEDGRKHLLLKEPIPLDIPVRLLHGMKDASVPAIYSHRLIERLTSSNVTLTLMKSGDHRLSQPGDLGILKATLKELSDGVSA